MALPQPGERLLSTPFHVFKARAVSAQFGFQVQNGSLI